MRPIKSSMCDLQTQVLDLSASVRQLSVKQADLETSDVFDVKTSTYTDVREPQTAEYVAEALTDLDQSLDSGEIDMEQYATSLRYVLGTDGRMRAAPYGAPLMTSTPQAPRKLTFDHPTTTAEPAIAHKPIDTCKEPQYSTIPTLDTKQRSTYEKTPIKRLPSTSISVASLSINPSMMMASAYDSKKSLATSQEPARNATENRAVTSNRSVASSTSKQTIAVKAARVQMDTILMEERASVQFWLGLDMAELNHFIAILNQSVEHHQKQLSESGLSESKEVSFTVDNVASYCSVDAKKAKAVVLLLCNLKRLKLVRGETTSYSILSGTTIQAK